MKELNKNIKYISKYKQNKWQNRNNNSILLSIFIIYSNINYIVFEQLWFKPWFHVDFVIPGSFVWELTSSFLIKDIQNLWYSGGTICSSVRSSFWFSIIARLVVKLVFEQIHTLLVSGFIQAPSSMICSSILNKGEIRASWQSVPRTLTVHVIHSFGSSSLEIEDLRGDDLVKRDLIFLKLNFQGMCCQWKEPVCQSITGLIFWSQGNPRSIFCFPNLVTSNWIICFCPKISKSKFTYCCLMVPFFFRVLSTLIARIGFSRFNNGRFRVLA